MATASKDSAAYQQYDEPLSEREEASRQLRAVKQTSRQLHKARRRASHRLGTYVGAAVIAAVYLLYCNMQLTQLTSEVSDQNTELERLDAESVSLASKIEYNMSTDELEQYATETLGMVKMDNSQIEYVQLTNPDVITVTESEMSLRFIGKRIVECVMNLVEYLR